MKTVKIALSISNIYDIEVNEPRENDVSLYVYMNEDQIKENIEALKKLLKKKRPVIDRIRMVK